MTRNILVHAWGHTECKPIWWMFFHGKGKEESRLSAYRRYRLCGKNVEKIMVFGSATSCVSYSGTMLTQKSWLSNLMHAHVTKVRHLYLSQNYLPAFFFCASPSPSWNCWNIDFSPWILWEYVSHFSWGSMVLIKYLRKRPWRMNSVCCITVYLHKDKRWRQLTTVGPHSGGREREMLAFNSLLFYSVQDPSPWDGAIHI